MPPTRFALARILSLALAACLPAPAGAANTPVLLAQNGQPRSVIVHPRDDRLTAVTARKLAAYLAEQTGAAVPITPEDRFLVPGRDTTVIVIDGTPGHRLAARFGQTIRLSSDRPEAYRLTVANRADGSPLVVVAGHTPAGAKYAAYRLMRELEVQGRDARLRPLDVEAAPFLPTRSIALFNVWGMPIELTRRHNTESWPIDRLERYLDMYDAFGFNAIESHDRFNDNYQENIVQAIQAAGHQPAVWTWYRADHEIRPSLHVHLHERLGDYFRGLPPSARALAWHNLERNVHGAANTANYYVGGRLMWDPSLDVDDLLREFLSLVFGSENAARVMPAYLAIEKIRCHSCYQNWESARLTGRGTTDPRADHATAQAALDQLAAVRPMPGFRPRLSLDVSPTEIIADLQASLEVMRDFARCRAEELPAVDRAIGRGDRTTAGRLLDELHARYNPWAHTLAGRQEWSVLNPLLTAKRKALAR